MDDVQASINEEGVGLKGFLPAVFARLVTEKLRALKGDIAVIRLTAPADLVRNRTNRPDTWETAIIEEQFKDPSYPTRQQVVVEADYKGRQGFQFILPEYYKEYCLACNGQSAGELDITWGKKEGGELGQLGGAISVLIFQ
jgi:hypothetical protein